MCCSWLSPMGRAWVGSGDFSLHAQRSYHVCTHCLCLLAFPLLRPMSTKSSHFAVVPAVDFSCASACFCESCGGRTMGSGYVLLPRISSVTLPIASLRRRYARELPER